MVHSIKEIESLIESVVPNEHFTYSVQQLCTSDERVHYERELLSERELNSLNRHRSEKRKNEWLTGRLAAKEAICKFTDEENCEIITGEQGEPVALSESKFTLTITHSHGVAIAVVGNGELGIDLEKIEARPHSFERFFFSEAEQNHLDTEFTADRSRGQTLLWTGKEAVSKVLGVGGTINFRTVECHESKAKIDSRETAIKLIKRSNKHFCVTLAIGAVRDVIDG